jgi:AmmeMemoRadiSam system protein B
MIRQPAVAGHFYTADPEALRSELSDMIPPSSEKHTVKGIIAPHAGYMYSGSVAGKVYGDIVIPRTVIVLGPNHHGTGARAALFPEGEWCTPLGSVPIEQQLSRLLRDRVPVIEEDSVAHHFEHSLEVQIPFLQYLRHDVAIVPVCLGFGDFKTCRELGEGIADAIVHYGESVLIVASSDMTHYESADSAYRKDMKALEEVLALNPQGLLDTCRKDGITMCGVVPATVMLVACIELGASNARVVQYATSGDVTGDKKQVVAYAAAEVW